MAFSLKAVLSVAGSDSSGGAGIQADIKTIAAHGLFAETAITALTAQNTLGVTGVANVDPAFVADQIDAVFDDIRPDAVKVGMVSSVAIMQAVAERLSAHGARNVVVDPVMVATSGARLIDEDAVAALRAHLLPLADLVTPNIPEAEVLCGFAIADEDAMERAARQLLDLCGGAVLVKGGHGANDANDVLALSDGRASVVSQPRHRHGEHPRHGLHAVVRHRLRACNGKGHGRSRGGCEGVRHRSARLRPWPRPRQRPPRSHVEPLRAVGGGGRKTPSSSCPHPFRFGSTVRAAPALTPRTRTVRP